MQDTAPPACRNDELAHWIRLAQTAGVGSIAARQLLSVFGSPRHVFDAGFDALRQIITPSVAHALLQPVSDATATLVDTTLAWLAQPGNCTLALTDAAYPSSLLNIPDPPLLLYVKGRLDLLAGPCLAVVGSRNASAQGMANAERFSQALSEAGLCIVSGLALGIDAAAHRGGLRGAGSSIAVIGTGPDIVYPRRNRGLAHQLAEQGCILSEYPLGLSALPGNFPRRNRLISGLSRGVLVVEAAARSGSLITAHEANEQGRDVFAIPGSIHSALSKGCHALIKQGAKLVESADDVLQELGLLTCSPGPPAPERGIPAAQAVLLAALGHDPAGADQLASRAGLDAADVIGQLLALELAGLVERLPGGLFQRHEP